MAEPLLLTALFSDHASAAHAFSGLAARGYAPTDIRLHMSGETRDRLLTTAVEHRRDRALAGLVTALVGRRVPEERSALYEAGVCAGGIVMGVSPATARDAEQLAREWRAAGATQIVCPLLDGRHAA